MKINPGDVVILTGASGGIGAHFVRALARLKTRLVLSAYPGNILGELRAEIEKGGCETVDMVCDLRDPDERAKLVQLAYDRFGRVDILINNAGVEFNSYYHELPETRIAEVLTVNLVAPLMLTRLVLPRMLAQKRGHIVNIASLAGKSGPAFQEPYAATKAALIAFTSSLRCTYRHETAISASAVVPGFVEAGIYMRLKAKAGVAAPALLGVSQPEAVVKAVIRAIEGDLPEVIVNPLPVRPLLALTAMFPRIGEWATAQFGATAFFKRAIDAEKKEKAAQ
jgi:short-subunit dehydrogenase